MTPDRLPPCADRDLDDEFVPFLPRVVKAKQIDAIHEVLNVASAVISTEGRAVFIKMVSDPVFIEGAAGTTLKKPDHRSYYNVLVDGYQGGKFTIFAQSAPV